MENEQGTRYPMYSDFNARIKRERFSLPHRVFITHHIASIGREAREFLSFSLPCRGQWTNEVDKVMQANP